MVKPVWNNAQRVNYQNFAKKTHPCAKKNLVPRAVLMKSGLVSINTARQNISKTAVLVNTARQVNVAHSKTTVNAARPMSYLSKTAHSTVKRPIHKNTTFKNSNINQKVNIVRGKKFNTARPKAVVNVVKGNNFNAVKASACWVWKPKHKVLDHGNPQMDLQDQGVIDSGCSRHMTGNMSYLTDYEEIDGGYVAFGGNPKGGKITRKCTIKTVDHKVKVIRCDNGTEFKNREMNQFCEMKGILRQFSVARTPQQNRVAERRNMTLIEAVRTMLADSKTPTLSFMRPFGCPVTILNTIDHLGKFDGKADEGFFVGYSLNSKAFRVFNSRTRIVKENLHIRFSKSNTLMRRYGPDSIDVDVLTRTMNYEPIVASTQSNGFAGTKASDNAGQARKETEPVKDYILLPLWTADPPYSQDPKSSHDDGSKPSSDDGKKVDEDPRKESECKDQEKEDNVNSTNNVNTISLTVNAAGINEVNAVGGKTSIELPFDPNMPALEDYSIFDFSRDDEDDGAVADMNNLDTTIQVSPIPTTRIHKDHPLDQEEPKKVIYALKDPSWIKAMQEELIQFKLQEVWTLVDLSNGKRAIGSKWMSSMGELTFFLGLQVQQKKDGIFISQDKYVDEILKKFRVLDLEKTKTTQANEIATRVESSDDKESLSKDASKQGRINAIDADEEITLVSVQDDADKEITAATTVTITTEEITLAQALEALKTSKPKVKGMFFKSQKKDQILLDEETALNLQAEFDEEEKLAREKAEKEQEANIALIETWDDIQAKIDADHQLAERLQAQEQEELSIEEKATLFQQLLEKRRKHFAAKRSEKKRNKPPTKAQQRKIMCTYLKNMEGYKLNDLKLKEFDSNQEMFDRAFKRQKVEDDKETTKIKKLIEIIPDEEEVAIDAIPLAVKSQVLLTGRFIKKKEKAINTNNKSRWKVSNIHDL
ncbi:ribonuclease H-like domain-containing protein [Tanacetum coccineum]